MYFTCTIILSLLATLLLPSAVFGAPIVQRSSTVFDEHPGPQTSTGPHNTRRELTNDDTQGSHASPGLRFGMPVLAATRGRVDLDGNVVKLRDLAYNADDTIHAREMGLSGMSMMPSSEIVAHTVADKFSGLLHQRDISEPVHEGHVERPTSQQSPRELGSTDPVDFGKISGLRFGLAAAGGVHPRDVAYDDAIRARGLGASGAGMIPGSEVIARWVADEAPPPEGEVPTCGNT